MIKFYFEIQPLFEENFTGISKVASCLARQLIGDSTIIPVFFFENKQIPLELIKLALDDNSGVRLRACTSLFHTFSGPIKNSIALYPNFKSLGRIFSSEAFILHDMSVFRFPEYHTLENSKIVRERLERDVKSSDFVFCVSSATRSEYFKIFPNSPSEKFSVIYNGIESPTTDEKLGSDKKIITILGTLEPRKNIEIVLHFIRKNISLLDSFIFYFPGRYGWGLTIKELINKYQLQTAIEGGGIAFPGYITEYQKEVLLNSSFALIYPSVYEGFGLPVGEALIRNIPVLTTSSTSLPEVGGGDAIYFEPNNLADFSEKFWSLVEMFDRKSTPFSPAKRIQDKFCWKKSYACMKEILLRGVN